MAARRGTKKGSGTQASTCRWQPASDASTPVPATELVADLQVNTSIARTDGLDLTNEVTLDGSATLEVKYL